MHCLVTFHVTGEGVYHLEADTSRWCVALHPVLVNTLFENIRHFIALVSRLSVKNINQFEELFSHGRELGASQFTRVLITSLQWGRNKHVSFKELTYIVTIIF